MRLTDKVYSRNTVTNYSQGFWHNAQLMSCQGYGGSFKLLYKGVPSPSIPYNSTVGAFQRLLQSTRTVGVVSIEALSGGHICNNVNGVVNITFVSELGGAPLLVPDTGGLTGHVSVVPGQWGHRVGLMECSGHGKCDRSTGTCMCWPHWVTSDGFGNKGTRGDCGHNDIA